MMKRIILLIIFFLVQSVQTFAQCAMCRATLENNVSNGESTEAAASLNFGILYLFAMPYLAVIIIAFLWYRNSRKIRDNQSINIRERLKA